ncbi:MAG: hypothetical protein KIT84_33895 [Labilithrix sp.]|nr:hypothetical protein [Labilithrix sp.]MCW5816040.1 hypothetical protein [Labilithrix sp.]
MGAFALAVAACSGDDEGDSRTRRAAAAPDGGGAGERAVTPPPPVLAGVPADIAIEPANGQLYDARTDDREVKFAGFTNAAGATVDVQVLSRPDAPITESSWITIATATSATTPTTYNDAEPIYRWSIVAIPSPRGSERWAVGGLLRYRTVMNAGGKRSALPFYDASSAACIDGLAGASWKEVLEKCKSPYSPALGAALGGSARAAALVSAGPAPATPPPYLSRKGDITAAATAAYYANIDAPATLTEFKARFGFLERGVIEATYFNAGDLGIGREMHCTSFANATDGGIACYVRNYGVDAALNPVFGGDQKAALDDAIARRNAFATVAMIKLGAKFAPKEGNDVRFYVYGADETLANRAPLDNFGLNQAIPNNCLNCHGGQNEGGRVVGASFLPFDPEAFRYAAEGERTYEAQEDRFRQLNALIASAGAPPPILQFVDGLYGGKAETAGTKANLDWIPKGWSDSEEAKTVYREVYKPYCRACHVSQVGDYAFMRFSELTKHSAETAESICATHEMPIAEVTTNAFLRSPARAYLVNTLGLSTPCSPTEPRK